MGLALRSFGPCTERGGRRSSVPSGGNDHQFLPDQPCYDRRMPLVSRQNDLTCRLVMIQDNISIVSFANGPDQKKDQAKNGGEVWQQANSLLRIASRIASD